MSLSYQTPIRVSLLELINIHAAPSGDLPLATCCPHRARRQRQLYGHGYEIDECDERELCARLLSPAVQHRPVESKAKTGRSP